MSEVPTRDNIKVTLQGTSLDTRAEGAQAVARYLVELDSDGAAGLSGNPDLLNQALLMVPPIGSSQDFPNPIQGAPVYTNQTQATSATYQTHQLRVYRQMASAGDTNNGNKPFVDVFYMSRQKPVIEFGYTAIQQQTQTYLSNENGGIFGVNPNDPTQRSQMVLDWKILKGTYFNDGGAPWPPEDTQLLKAPVNGTMFRFGSSMRISSEWFNDEVTQTEFNLLATVFNTAVNQTRTPFSPQDQVGIPDDTLKWLITGINTVTTNGGWTTRATMEMIFSPYGWDTYAIYQDPFSGNLAIISKEVMGKLYQLPAQVTGAFADSYVPKGGGAGRFVQQKAVPFNDLIGFMSQGLFAPQKTIADMLGYVGRQL